MYVLTIFEKNTKVRFDLGVLTDDMLAAQMKELNEALSAVNQKLGYYPKVELREINQLTRPISADALADMITYHVTVENMYGMHSTTT